MKAIKLADDFQLQVIATGMHLSPEFGLTYRQLKEDGFHIDARVDLLVSSDSAIANSKSVGLGVIGFSDAFDHLQPDLVLLLGDRYEIFSAAQAAMFAQIPLAHIAGGDTSEGAFDEAIRHSISKMAHIHLVTNDDAQRRLIQLGEDPAHVHKVGSPALDRLVELELLDRETLEGSLGFRLRQKNLLITQHPVTLARDRGMAEVQALFEALETLGDEVGLIFTKSNADAGGQGINTLIDKFVAQHGNAVAHTSLGQLRYYSLMAQVDAMVGNSSSGLYEAPSFKLPTVNIGDRQKGRLKASSVLDCPASKSAILATIHRAWELDCSGVSNPYGDGHSTERILAILRAEPSFDTLLSKHFHDLK
jgi:UDP-N-acetylglucosamine 2-epimerase (non-hydrolysing)/GDP/UDP-N,N'-diacetylbacillosamine 2-epimerase (hydrolysing)